MKKISCIAMVLFFVTLIPAGIGYAADEQASLGTQAGEAVRELKDTTNKDLSTGATKVAESSREVEAEAQETLKTLQRQWDVLVKQLQEKTQQIQKELAKQWQDFNQSFNKPPKS
ncbi:MAG: hypothetical protein V1673_02400 [Candidatus Omnitrophota bacterium]